MRKLHSGLSRKKHDIRNFATTNMRLLNAISTQGVVPMTQGLHKR